MKKNTLINTDVIVIGGDHYNALGVIRSLGECGIRPYFVLLNDTKNAMSAQSKYIKKLFLIKESEEDNIDNFLISNFGDANNKKIIIPTGDPIEKYLDEHYKELSAYFYLPNINETEGMITKYMDKLFQYELCKKNKVNIAESFFVDLNKKIDYNVFPNKVIIKPDVSADGNKADIIIATGISEIKKGLKSFKEKKYQNVLIQEFLDYSMEYAMMGIAYKDKVIIPGINSNNFIYPSNRGNTSYAEMFPLSEFKYNISNIEKMVSNMGYTGLFEIEMFLVGDKIYFNEMNFRNSANLYGYKGGKIKYIYIYLLLLLNISLSNEKLKVTNHYNFCIEPLHIKNVFEGKIGFFKCIYHILTSTKLIYNFHDIKPFFAKYRYAIKKRLCKGKK